MYVTEIFTSIQGEGPAIGRPMHFLRLHGCNRHCLGCDTESASFSPRSAAKQMSVTEVGRTLQGLGSAYGVVVTGGEPFLQATELAELMRSSEIRWHLETNGSITEGPFVHDVLYRANLIVVSPKSVSGPQIGHGYLDVSEMKKIITAWAATDVAISMIHFKFPIDVETLSEAAATNLHQVLSWIPKGASFSLMPVDGPTFNVSPGEALKKLVVIAKSYPNGRVLPRLHRLIWGNVQGV